jgi:hypothetical protein
MPVHVFIAIAAALSGQASEPAALELSLLCRGTGQMVAPVQTTTVQGADNLGYGVSANATTSAVVAYDTTAGFRLQNGTATMRIPGMFLPQMHGGQAGWFKVKNLQVSEREITGKVSINFMNSSTFRIDRTSGQLSTSGGFTADCEPEDLTKRRF